MIEIEMLPEFQNIMEYVTRMWWSGSLQNEMGVLATWVEHVMKYQGNIFATVLHDQKNRSPNQPNQLKEGEEMNCITFNSYADKLQCFLLI